jgi:hypothetical protein
MPNWCSNTLTLGHSDPAEIARAVEAFKRGELLNEFVPLPESENENWYDWHIANWGTKWDVGGDSYGDPSITEDGRSMSVNFDSAWSPPTQWYENMQALGFDITAMYYEPGMCFAGKYDEHGDESYEFSGLTSDEVRDALPQDLDDMFAISETMADYEDEEPLTEWYVEGAKKKGLIKDDGDD